MLVYYYYETWGEGNEEEEDCFIMCIAMGVTCWTLCNLYEQKWKAKCMK